MVKAGTMILCYCIACGCFGGLEFTTTFKNPSSNTGAGQRSLSVYYCTTMLEWALSCLESVNGAQYGVQCICSELSDTYRSLLGIFSIIVDVELCGVASSLCGEVEQWAGLGTGLYRPLL